MADRPPRILTYASTSRANPDVLFDEDGATLTLHPDRGFDATVHLAVVIGLAVLFAAFAACPETTSAIFRTKLASPLSAGKRVILASLAALFILIAADARYRSRRAIVLMVSQCKLKLFIPSGFRTHVRVIAPPPGSTVALDTSSDVGPSVVLHDSNAVLLAELLTTADTWVLRRDVLERTIKVVNDCLARTRTKGVD